MLYSNLPIILHSTIVPNKEEEGFFLRHQILLGTKLGLRILCPPQTTIFPGTNEDLVVRYNARGVFSIEKLVLDWRDSDPTWNWPEQIFLLLFGENISVREKDFPNIKRLTYLKNEEEHYELFQVDEGNTILKVQEHLTKNVRYLYIKPGMVVTEFEARSETELRNFANKFSLNYEEDFACEWIDF